MINRSTKKHTKEWVQQNAPLIWVQMIYDGDTNKMPQNVSFTFDGHYFESVKQKTTFFACTESTERAQKFGEDKYQNTEFLRSLIKKMQHIENELRTTANSLTHKDCFYTNNEELYLLLSHFFDVYAKLVGIYRFTRPNFYEKVITTLRKTMTEPIDQNLVLLLKNDFDAISCDPSPQVKNLATYLKKIGELRFAMHETYLSSFSKADTLFTEIGRRLRSSSLEIKNHTIEELKDALLSNQKMPHEEIWGRIQYFKFIYHKNFFEITTQPENKKYKEKKRSTETLTGTTANQGKATGTVKVINESLSGVLVQEMQKMNTGDILVTTSTSPDMMIAINKAAAIVTNVGGLLSHAAIVSRELNIPCVIGTAHATEALTDGDVVEVDATKGIVHIISHAQIKQ